MRDENYVPLHVLVKLVPFSAHPLIDVRTFPTCCLEESWCLNFSFEKFCWIGLVCPFFVAFVVCCECLGLNFHTLCVLPGTLVGSYLVAFVGCIVLFTLHILHNLRLHTIFFCSLYNLIFVWFFLRLHSFVWGECVEGVALDECEDVLGCLSPEDRVVFVSYVTNMRWQEDVVEFT